MDPLKRDDERALTSRRRRPTAHPWADAYLRAHGIEDATLRAEIVSAIVARAESLSEDDGLDDSNGRVMQVAQEFLDERLSAFVGGFAPGQEAVAGRVAFQLAEGPRHCPSALLDPATAPAALRFAMRTARVPRMPALVRASMVSRPARASRAPARGQEPPQRWLRFVLCALSLALVTCHS